VKNAPEDFGLPTRASQRTTQPTPAPLWKALMTVASAGLVACLYAGPTHWWTILATFASVISFVGATIHWRRLRGTNPAAAPARSGPVHSTR
jgi:hypothetical protein